MNGFILLLPFFFFFFVVLAFLDKASLQRAAMFAPLKGNEKPAYYIYQLTNAGIILYPFFLTVKPALSPFFLLELICYLLGLLLCLVTVAAFASPGENGLNTDGIYRFSRNPMYVSYFFCFLGIALLTRSLLLLGVVLLFQVSGHFIILSEERWCRKKFGTAYEEYCRKVPRYI